MHFVWANDGANKLLHITCVQEYSLYVTPCTLHEAYVSAGAVVRVRWELWVCQATPAPCHCCAWCLTSGTARLPRARCR